MSRKRKPWNPRIVWDFDAKDTPPERARALVRALKAHAEQRRAKRESDAA